MNAPIRSKKFTPIAAAIALAFSSAHVLAADENTESTENKNQDIERIAIVGQTTNTVITPEELEKFQANDLSDIFRTVPSVSVGGSLSIVQKIYIRGMEDTLLNITVDGAPQTSTIFHHIGRVSVDPYLLQEVDVQAGAGEATSSFGAIGGAIRFKTKDVNDLLDGDEDFGGRVKASYYSNDGHRTAGTMYGRLSDSWGIIGSYTKVTNENMEDGAGNELYGTAADQDVAYFKLSGELSNNQTLSFSYEKRNEEADLAKQPNWGALEGAELYPVEGERETMVLNHSIALHDFVNVETTAYNTESEFKRELYNYQGNIKTYGFDLRNTSYLDSHTLTLGVEYRSDEVTAREQGGSILAKEEGEVFGLYFQDHWKVNDDLLVSYGARYDQYDLEQVTYDNEVDSDGISLNIGAIYSFNDNWELNLGYAEAMRGKEIGDAFTIEQWGAGWVSIDPELEAEEVDNTEIGLTYHDQSWNITATVYKSDIDNVILDQIGGSPSYYFENVGTLETEGFELKAGYIYEALEVVASFSTNDTELNGETVEGYEHIGLGNSRGDTYALNVHYALNDNVELGWNFNYVDSLDNIEVLQRAVELGWIDKTYEIDKPSYSVHDVYLQWQPLDEESLMVNFTVQNLFDEHYRDHSSVGSYEDVPGWESVAGIYEAGRDIRVSVSYEF